MEKEVGNGPFVFETTIPLFFSFGVTVEAKKVVNEAAATTTTTTNAWKAKNIIFSLLFLNFFFGYLTVNAACFFTVNTPLCRVTGFASISLLHENSFFYNNWAKIFWFFGLFCFFPNFHLLLCSIPFHFQPMNLFQKWRSNLGENLFSKQGLWSLFVYFRLFKQTLQFLQQVYGAGIWTHDLQNVSLLS